MDPTEFDCNTCGACCAYTADWPMLESSEDHGPEGPEPEWVVDGHIRWAGDRCGALRGVVGVSTRCIIYARRPSPCRGCGPGSTSCLVARRHHGLPVPEQRSTMDDLFPSC